MEPHAASLPEEFRSSPQIESLREQSGRSLSPMLTYHLDALSDDDKEGVNLELPSTKSRASLTYFELQKATMERANKRKPQHLAASERLPMGYQRVRVEDDGVIPPQELLEFLRIAIGIRYRYFDPSLHNDGPPFSNNDTDPFSGSVPGQSNHQYEMVDGVVQFWTLHDRSDIVQARSVSEFYADLEILVDIVANGPCKTFCYKRLEILSSKFTMHCLLNSKLESDLQKLVPHRDFYNVRKIDNHIHHSACMNQKHLLRFIKRKLREEGNLEVVARDGRILTLRQVFDSLNLTEYDLSIDALDMHAHQDSFHRFDKFNQKYNPVGETRLREIFIKTDNRIKGRFLAEITKEVFDDLASNKYQFAELRLSIYGRSAGEWGLLAKWVTVNKLFSPNVRWMIQIPRLFAVYKTAGFIDNFQQIIDNIFLPLFAITVNPSSDPQLHQLLKLVVAFDTVDDESQREPVLFAQRPTPSQWNLPVNPPYSMWSYYISANLQVLNKLRKSLGMNTFSYRPHAGEAGDIDHCSVAFLTAESIAHGLMLRKTPVLQYLYYLTQIGISMSPLSNNMLFVPYDKNPFPKFFAQGLNVTLSTDDPLLIHFTKEPLLEEYSVAAQVWKLSSVDMCEIACNSVHISGFQGRFKKHWLGSNFRQAGVAGNHIQSTNIPDVRVAFRRELFETELQLVYQNTLDLPSIGHLWNPRGI